MERWQKRQVSSKTTRCWVVVTVGFWCGRVLKTGDFSIA
jgi:hypothetical protein